MFLELALGGVWGFPVIVPGAVGVEVEAVGHEIEGVDEATAREAFRLASAKLSVSTMFLKRQVR